MPRNSASTGRLLTQYGDYLAGLLRGQFRRLDLHPPAGAEDLAAYLPATLELVFAAMLLAIVIGIPAGCWRRSLRDRWPDYVSRVVALGAISMPRFFLGLVLQLGLRCGWAGCRWAGASAHRGPAGAGHRPSHHRCADRPRSGPSPSR
jgi:ABC-type dipeptide/oligopeptide/nickel transport system permease component